MTASVAPGIATRPVTWRFTVSPGRTGPRCPPLLVRVSRSRAGTIGLRSPSPPTEFSGVPTQPATSASTSVWPAALKNVTWPPLPTPTSTRLGTVVPADQFRLDATGRVTPVGYTVRKLPAVVPGTVPVITTSETPVDGVPRVLSPEDSTPAQARGGREGRHSSTP